MPDAQPIITRAPHETRCVVVAGDAYINGIIEEGGWTVQSVTARAPGVQYKDGTVFVVLVRPWPVEVLDGPQG